MDRSDVPTIQEMRNLLEGIKTPGLKKLFTLLPVRKRPTSKKELIDRILEVPTDGLFLTNDQIKDNARAFFSILTTDVSLVVYMRIREMVDQTGVAPFNPRENSASDRSTSLRSNIASSNNIVTPSITRTLQLFDNFKMVMQLISRQLKSKEPSSFKYIKSIRDRMNKLVEDLELCKGMISENGFNATSNLNYVEDKLAKLRVRYDKAKSASRTTVKEVLLNLPEYEEQTTRQRPTSNYSATTTFEFPIAKLKECLSKQTNRKRRHSSQQEDEEEQPKQKTSK